MIITASILSVFERCPIAVFFQLFRFLSLTLVQITRSSSLPPPSDTKFTRQRFAEDAGYLGDDASDQGRARVRALCPVQSAQREFLTPCLHLLSTPRHPLSHVREFRGHAPLLHIHYSTQSPKILVANSARCTVTG